MENVNLDESSVAVNAETIPILKKKYFRVWTSIFVTLFCLLISSVYDSISHSVILGTLTGYNNPSEFILFSLYVGALSYIFLTLGQKLYDERGRTMLKAVLGVCLINAMYQTKTFIEEINAFFPNIMELILILVVFFTWLLLGLIVLKCIDWIIKGFREKRS